MTMTIPDDHWDLLQKNPLSQSDTDESNFNLRGSVDRTTSEEFIVQDEPHEFINDSIFIDMDEPMNGS